MYNYSHLEMGCAPRASIDTQYTPTESIFTHVSHISQEFETLEEGVEPKCVFLTGATGFLGKVVLEDLLRNKAKYNLSKVIVLTRGKYGIDPHQRFQKKVLSSPCFSKLTNPKNSFESVQVVVGDLSAPSCGMDWVTYGKVAKEITHIIHCAASVDFELPLMEAIEANVSTSMNVLELAKNSPGLQRFVSTSTAYVTPHKSGPISEVLVPLPWPAERLYEDIKSGKRHEHDVLAATGHPNTYTLTKAIAEHLLVSRKGSVPLTIVRPSIISTSRELPFPGWVDSHAAFTAFAATYGAGLLRVCDVNNTTHLDIIPVDDVTKRLIDEAFFAQRGPTASTPIIYAVASLENTIPISTVVQILTTTFPTLDNPKGLNPVGIYVGPRTKRFHIHKFFHHTLRLHGAGVFFAATRNKKMGAAVRKQRKILSILNRVFPHFTHNTYDFRPSVRLADDFCVEAYLKVVCEGVNEHLLKRA